MDDESIALTAMLDLDHPLKVEVADWARENLSASPETFDRFAWSAAAGRGILGVVAPPPYGTGGSAVEAMLMFEGLGLGATDTGLVFALASHVFAVQTAISGFGRRDQLETWLGPMCRGDSIGSFAMTEPLVGSDFASITTTATERSGGGYVLDGTKAWITLAPVCDVVIVFATVDPSLGRWGITAFLVPVDTPGLEVGPVEAKLGLRSCPFGRIELNGCEVPEDAILGRVGAGASVFLSSVEAERAFLYAAQLGATERTLGKSVERSRTRAQSGRPIGAFQAVSHRIADMKLRHESARLLVYKAASIHDRGGNVAMAAALAKLAASEGAVLSALDAVTIHGAEGYAESGGVEVDLRDAVGGLAYSGTSDIQRNIVAGLLGTDRPR